MSAAPALAPALEAVAVLLLDADGHTWLAERRGPGMAGLLECPGGKVEPYEGMRWAAARELREEAGLSVAQFRLVPVGSIAVRHDSEAGRTVLVALFVLHLAPGECPADTEPECRGPWVRHEARPSRFLCTPSTGALLALAPWALPEATP